MVVLGEPMVERHLSPQSPDSPDSPDSPGSADGSVAPRSVSGDAFNAACAAVLAGARVALLTVLGTDDAGDLVLDELARRGVDSSLVLRGPEPTGAYTVAPDAHGQPRFSYQRAGSAASTLSPAHLERWGPVLEATPVLLTSGITAALSAGAAQLVIAAVARVAGAGGAACYDVNFRPELTDADPARRVLRAVAPHCRLVKIASPGDSAPLLGVTDPAAVTAALGALTGAAVAVTRGAAPLFVTDGGHVSRHPAIVLPTPVDSTGAGDTLLGTLAAGLARGERLADAAPLAVVAAGLSTQHRGGAPTATLDELRTAQRAATRTEPAHVLIEEARP
ncbi:MAG: 2-dehydro-3-deoxygluconokinase [Pseudonocardiales bacterium]|nr:2-dehydro-3-deoxygluconokinase [Pseudonocardiales bacterium]